jgi:hypothetical protein
MMKTFTFTWVDTSGDGVGLPTDVFHGCIYNPSYKEFIPATAGRTRSQESCATPLPAHWTANGILDVYGAFRRADGLDSSETMYVRVSTE